MGFMGLSCICDSDNASDTAHGISDRLADSLRKACRKKGNTYNTPGYLDVALYYKEIICPCDSQYIYMNEKLRKLAKDLIGAVKEARNEMKDGGLRAEMMDIIRALYAFLQKDTYALQEEEDKRKKKKRN